MKSEPSSPFSGENQALHEIEGHELLIVFSNRLTRTEQAWSLESIFRRPTFLLEDQNLRSFDKTRPKFDAQIEFLFKNLALGQTISPKELPKVGP